MEEGDSHFLDQGLGLALGAKTCPHRPQAFKRKAINEYTMVQAYRPKFLQGPMSAPTLKDRPCFFASRAGLIIIVHTYMFFFFLIHEKHVFSGAACYFQYNSVL